MEKLVAELGDVCTSRHEVHSRAQREEVPETRVDDAVRRATRAVTAALSGGPDEDEDDVVVREAWAAVARAQDAIATLRATVEGSRALRARAQRLQDQSFRLRASRPQSGPAAGPARREMERD